MPSLLRPSSPRLLAVFLLLMAMMVSTFAIAASPAAAATGPQIVYASGSSAIYVMNADGTGNKMVNSDGYAPAWSPNRTKIAFIRSGNLLVMNADGTGVKTLIRDKAYQYDPSWSPDGQQIVYETYGDNGNLWIINADGTNARQITSGTGNEFDPDWSPDGTQIAFAKSTGGFGSAIAVTTPAGGEGTILYENNNGVGDPQWSPDGASIAWQKFDWAQYHLMVNGASVAVSEKSINSPAWSPDGQTLIYGTQTAGVETFGPGGVGMGSGRQVDWAFTGEYTAPPPPPPGGYSGSGGTDPSAKMDFVWRAEDRLLEVEGTGGGAGAYTTEDINRPFRVFFDACASYPEPTEWHWFIDGVESPSSPSLACNSYFHEFPKEGNFQVTLKSIKTVDGVEEVTAWTTKTVTVKDHLIVSLGDSYSSGEGNPPWTNATDSETCHRSAAAATAQTALRFEQADPQTTVTFLHLACTGATVDEGLLGAYTSKGLPPQMSRAAGLLADRRLDVDTMFISIGGNDIHFSSIIRDCMEMADCHKQRSVTTRLRDDLVALPARYDRVAACIGAGVAPSGCELGSPGGVGLSAGGKTFTTQYPDATRDQNGAYCSDVLSVGKDGVQAPEFEWAAQSVMGQSSGKGTKPGLNDEVSAAAGRHGWTYIDGMDEAFRTHGYCSSGTWFVSLSESLVQQWGKEGSFHPNIAGHTVQADIITSKVKGVMGL